MLAHGRALGADVQQPALEAAEVREADVLRLAPLEQQPLRLAVLRREAEPRRDRAAGLPRRQPSAADQHLALVRRVEAVDQAQQLRAPGADEAPEPDDLAGPHLQAD